MPRAVPSRPLRDSLFLGSLGPFGEQRNPYSCQGSPLVVLSSKTSANADLYGWNDDVPRDASSDSL